MFFLEGPWIVESKFKLDIRWRVTVDFDLASIKAVTSIFGGQVTRSTSASTIWHRVYGGKYRVWASSLAAVRRSRSSIFDVAYSMVQPLCHLMMSQKASSTFMTPLQKDPNNNVSGGYHRIQPPPPCPDRSVPLIRVRRMPPTYEPSIWISPWIDNIREGWNNEESLLVTPIPLYGETHWESGQRWRLCLNCFASWSSSWLPTSQRAEDGTQSPRGITFTSCVQTEARIPRPFFRFRAVLVVIVLDGNSFWCVLHRDNIVIVLDL